MTTETQWLKEKCGNISASELHKLVIGKRGGVTEATLDYISRKRFERRRGYPIKENNAMFRKGKEHEPEAIYWLKKNYPELDILYSGDEGIFPVPPFYTVTWANFGASPDAETNDGTIVFDTKILCTPKTICFFDDQTIPDKDKRDFVIKEHGSQIEGLLLTRPKCKEFWIVKYNPQDDDNALDLEPTTAPHRGYVFKFKRKEFKLKETKHRIMFFDAFIDSNYPPSMIKDASFEVKGKKRVLHIVDTRNMVTKMTVNKK